MDNFVIHEYKAMLQEQLPVLKEVGTYKTNSEFWNSTDKIVDVMNQFFCLENMAEEYCYMVAFDTKFHPLAVFEVSHGTVDASLLQGREVFLRLCLVGAVNFVLLHNHPSGITTPSKADTIIAEKMNQLGKLTDIPLIDFIIVGKQNYFSFKEKGLL